MINEESIKKLKSNLDAIEKRIGTAAKKSGRSRNDIIVVAVSKTIPVELLQEANKLGMINFGENRVQEFLEKYDIINSGCNWHHIGHLQKNKVKYIIDKVKLIHSVDSIELVKEIEKQAIKANCKADILIQVNVSGESTKYGIEPLQTIDFLKEASQYKNIRVRGLMTMAPYSTDVETARPHFKRLNKIFIDTSHENIDNINMDFLSMGMSNDFEVAIEEGSNVVRIGTALFDTRGS